MKKQLITAAFSVGLSMCGVAAFAQTALTQTEVDNIYTSVFESSAKTYVSVHDPSIVEGYGNAGNITGLSTNGTKSYFVFGSHRGWAKSSDLKNWSAITNNLSTDYKNLLSVPAVWSALGGTQSSSTGSYDVTGNMWAPDVIWNKSLNKWCLYMSVNGDYWYSSIVMHTSETLDGDWTYVGPVVYSGFHDGETNTAKTDFYDIATLTSDLDLTRYAQKRNGNITYAMNCIDPCVYYDNEDNLWLSYGSWFGGMYVIRLDKSTGLRDKTYTFTTASTDPASATEDVYQGRKIAGGNNVSGEASYVKYFNGKYYLFVTYGGLVAAGGYNMRVFVSDNPDGPFTDMLGNDARYSTSNTGPGSINGNTGIRLMSYYQYDFMNLGNVAQGHNSALVDDDGKAYLVYHTRFNDGSEGHQVRVHRLYSTKNGYLTASPFEYNGNNYDNLTISNDDIPGYYNILYHGSGTDYANLQCVNEQQIQLKSDGTVAGAYTGYWSYDGTYFSININGIDFEGVAVYQDYEGLTYKSLCFSAVGNNMSVWGYKLDSDSNIFDAQTAIAYTAHNLSIPKKTYSGAKLGLNTTGSYNTKISWSNADGYISSDGNVSTVSSDLTTSLAATISCGSYTYTKTLSVQILKDSPASMAPSVLDVYSGPDDFNSYVANSKINGQTGLNISFMVEGLTTDWTAIAHSTDNLYIMYLSVLHYNAGNVFESSATASNGGSWTSFLNGSYFATVSFNPDGSIAYYKNGKLILTYPASLIVTGSTTVKDVCSAVINYYRNGQLLFNTGTEATVSYIITGYSALFDATNYNPFDYSKYAFYEDYDLTGSAASWYCPNGSVSTSSTTEYASCIKISPLGSGNRSALNSFTGVDALSEYTCVFDVQATNGNVDARSVGQIALVNADNATQNNSAVTDNYIFMLQTPVYSTSDLTTLNTWYINNNIDLPITIPSDAWVRITCKVNTDTKTVETTIIDRDTKTEYYSGTTSTNGSAVLKGLRVLAGRGNGFAFIDNINAYDSNISVETLDEYNQKGDVSQICSIVDSNENIIIYSSGRKIIVKGAQNEDIEVFNINGVKIFNGIASSDLSEICVAQRGILIVKAGKKIEKIYLN